MYICIFIGLYTHIWIFTGRLIARGGGPRPAPCQPLTYSQTRDFRERATSAPAELGAEIRNVSRSRARAQVPPLAPKLHVCRNGAFVYIYI